MAHPTIISISRFFVSLGLMYLLCYHFLVFYIQFAYGFSNSSVSAMSPSSLDRPEI